MALIVILGIVFYVSNGDLNLVTEYGENTRLIHVLDQNKIS